MIKFVLVAVLVTLCHADVSPESLREALQKDVDAWYAQQPGSMSVEVSMRSGVTAIADGYFYFDIRKVHLANMNRFKVAKIAVEENLTIYGVKYNVTIYSAANVTTEAEGSWAGTIYNFPASGSTDIVLHLSLYVRDAANVGPITSLVRLHRASIRNTDFSVTTTPQLPVRVSELASKFNVMLNMDHGDAPIPKALRNYYDGQEPKVLQTGYFKNFAEVGVGWLYP